jgi:hypothetical protein
MVLQDKQVNFIKKLIYDATLSEEWLKEVDLKLEEDKNTRALPPLLYGFYTLAPTNFSFLDPSREPTIQTKLRKIMKKKNMEKNPPQNTETVVKVLDIEKSMYETNPPNWKEFDVSDIHQSLDPYLNAQIIDFNIPMMTLFAHIGIQSSKTSTSNEEKFSIQPGCQPNVNNRGIDKDYIRSKKGKESKEDMVKGIFSRADLGWESQKTYFLPYEIRPNERKETSNEENTVVDQASSYVPCQTDAPLTCALSATNKEDNDEDLDKASEDRNEFGNLHARICSVEVATKTLEALSVSLYIRF